MRRIPELDAVRGIAAIMIVLYHLRFMVKFPVLATGVDLFFVLSGYLITRIILEESGRPGFLRIFYTRRALRIFPVYYLALVVVLLTNRLLYRPDPLGGPLQYWTYTQGLQHYWGAVPPFFSRMYLHTWTLALEEQFYLVWPLLVSRAGRKGVCLLALPMMVASAWLRGTGLSPNLLLSRCDGLAMGAVLAVALGDGAWTPRRLRLARGLFATIALAAGVASLWRGRLIGPLAGSIPGYRWEFIVPSLETSVICLFYAALIGLIVVESGSRRLAPLRDFRLRNVGMISYGLYVYHPIVFGLTLAAHTQLLGWQGSWRIDIFKFFACFFVAIASWRWMERPILRWKDRFTYRARAVPAPHYHASPSVSSSALDHADRA